MESKIELAQLLFKQKKYQETIDTCNQISSTDKNSIEALKLIAKSFLATSKIDTARLYFEQILTLKLDDYEVITYLGNTYQAVGDFINAKNHYKKAIEINNTFVPALINLGNIELIKDNKQEALSLLIKATKVDSNSAPAWINIANVYLQIGKLQEAEISFRKVIEINPNFFDAHLNLGALLCDIGKLQEAEISIRKAIELNPNVFNSHYVLGNILLRHKKLQEAEISFRKAIELNPNFSEAHYQLGIILRDNEKFEEAENSFIEAIKLKLGFVQAYDALASIQQKLGKQKEAEESFNKVLHLKSTNSANFGSNQKEKSTFIRKASEIEYLNLYRPGMGTENVGVFLKSMVMMLRPKRILEIGAGYTTPFLLEALINNERVFDDGNLMESYFKNYIYNPKLIIIDNQSLGELSKVEGMEEIVNSEYTNFIEGNFEGKGEELFKEYGHFDFVWFDCGGEKEYSSFITEYWDYCSNYLFFHFTYANGKPNNNHKIIRDLIKGNPIIFDIVEPHKKRQGSITIVQKQI